MYRVVADTGVVAMFDTVIEAITYCVQHHWLLFKPNGEFSLLEIED